MTYLKSSTGVSSRYIRGDDEGNRGGGTSSFLRVESLFWHKVSAPTIVVVCYKHADVAPCPQEPLPYSGMIIIPNFKEMCHFLSQFLREIHNSLFERTEQPLSEGSTYFVKFVGWSEAEVE
jgi:hypothetical protein